MFFHLTFAAQLIWNVCIRRLQRLVTSTYQYVCGYLTPVTLQCVKWLKRVGINLNFSLTKKLSGSLLLFTSNSVNQIRKQTLGQTYTCMYTCCLVQVYSRFLKAFQSYLPFILFMYFIFVRSYIFIKGCLIKFQCPLHCEILVANISFCNRFHWFN